MLVGVVCEGINHEIGINNKCCFRIPEDRKFFRELIKDQIVVVGRKTYEYLPKSVLKDCKHVHVLSTKYPLPIEYITSNEPVYVIGGSKTYESLDVLTCIYYVTHVNNEYINADSFFNVNLQRFTDRKLIESGNNYQIVKYIDYNNIRDLVNK